MATGTALHLENQLCFPLYVASRLLTKAYAPLLDELDITYPQYLVLLALWESDRQPVTALGQRLYLDTNTLTPLLKRLERKGLVRRERSTEDERKVIVRLSETGDQLRQRAACIPEKITGAGGKSALSRRQLDNFRRMLWQMIEQLG
ncbi:MarR family transcriptional regulator [Neolewinella xylanilytica]|uniref:MarR family transcriptional regulator n=1 Tax=Neolewinella xylanilytica TaxID=1514080 RepID=A0A2S6IAE9_9BACT|nr:MarR family transcriptional regulator [Neolewinella xylanilytica]PPK88452.1 MarR family transcriptional regulator [Neolewinella xylanilytica]